MFKSIYGNRATILTSSAVFRPFRQYNFPTISDSLKVCGNPSEIRRKRLYHREMPHNGDKILQKNEEHDQTADPICCCAVCPDYLFENFMSITILINFTEKSGRAFAGIHVFIL